MLFSILTNQILGNEGVGITLRTRGVVVVAKSLCSFVFSQSVDAAGEVSAEPEIQKVSS